METPSDAQRPGHEGRATGNALLTGDEQGHTTARPVPAVTTWAARIQPHLTDAVDSIVAAGRELIAAKDALPHGEFGPLLDKLGISSQTSSRFMHVARHPLIANSPPEGSLPPAVTVLDVLARLDPDDLTDAIERGDVTPSTTRTEALALARPEPGDQVAEQPQVGVDRRQTPVDIAARDAQERRDAIRRQVSWLGDFLRGWEAAISLHNNPLRDEVLAALDAFDRHRLLIIAEDLALAFAAAPAGHNGTNSARRATETTMLALLAPRTTAAS